MHRHTLALALAAALAGARLANAQPDELAHDQEVRNLAAAAHAKAVKAGDKMAIDRTRAEVRAADEAIYNDKRDAAEATAGPAKGETREAELRLINAKDAAQRALESGDPVAIQRTKQELRLAYAHDYAVRHGEKPHT